ncbi:MAG TPA: glycoside hydrolase family 38 C-terminal domain-containing protein [Kiritimatiellia bacterium]|nr:glycoside hydrolase family 38 C-terminal domain-containing protein [Kiritimatiellia bacterium]HMP32767.1 glycoside hydrolase family 38 C-terminal domain-containing protein [Kiritimatiellia bacterium]
MLISPKTLEKLRRIETTYLALIHEPIADLACSYLETDEHRRAVPGESAGWQPCPSGTAWGQAWGSAWFRTEMILAPEQCDGPLVIEARTGGVEALFWLDGRPAGIFNYDPWVRIRGDHRVQRIDEHPVPGRTIHIAVESYAGHPSPGSQPFETLESQTLYPAPFTRRFDGIRLCRRHDDIARFVLDLRALNQLSASLSSDSFRKGAVDAALVEVFALVPQEPSGLPRATWRAALARAVAVMAPLLACRNGDTAPFAGLVGHSHMDTAWHWTLDETIRKCARTYANALRLMEQYPEYVFVQSSALHAEWMRRHYPDIFDGIRRRVAEGRWEPNGGSWIEPDVNLAGGESLVRQFLRGDAFTREHFGYRADTFWLPDTFGYSAALPQILRGCGIRYFATTKLTWNESNTFPYDTFWWEGIDGSRVFAHFPDIHCAPDPETLINKLHGTGPKDFRVVQNSVRHKEVNRSRLIAYGYGDGGGGPDAHMIEMARRCRDLEGCPRAEHVTVSAFMQRLERETPAAPVYAGELYLEAHRGTLTQLHDIKRGNRRAEFALREAEILGVCGGTCSDGWRARWHAAWDLLLVNQFHDILPGTSIQEVHDRAIAELRQVCADAEALAAEAAATQVRPADDRITVFNTLSWPRQEACIPGLPANRRLAGCTSQRVTTPWGASRTVAHALDLPPLGARSFPLAPEEPVVPATSPFSWDGHAVTTPLLRARFAETGGLASVWLFGAKRELAADGGLPLNTFRFGEDIPAAWDNWDIDADLALKLTPSLQPEERTVVADGPLQFRVRQSFRFGMGSRLIQDVVFYAATLRIDFETVIHWRESHAFLLAEFPLAVRAPSARHEIQFGHLERPTHRNSFEDRARFEVCQHKWTDLSENRFGVALLNDGKYGVSVEGGTIRLSLHKGGCHPDPRGDRGDHVVTYSLLPHEGAFSADHVVRAAYELNVAPTVITGSLPGDATSLFTIDVPNLVVEAIKPAEDGRGYMVRLYECERQATRATIRFSRTPAAVFTTNLLEEPVARLDLEADVIRLPFRPFDLVSIQVIP